MVVAFQYVTQAAVLAIGMMLWLTLGVCKSAPTAIASTLKAAGGCAKNFTAAEAVTQGMNGYVSSVDATLADLFSPVEYSSFTVGSQISKVCAESEDIKTAAIFMFAGCAITMFAQIQLYAGMVMMERIIK